MTLVWRITIDSFDKTSKKKSNGSQIVVEKVFASTDSNNTPRFFQDKNKAFENALFKVLDSNIFDTRDLAGMIWAYDVSKLKKNLITDLKDGDGR